LSSQTLSGFLNEKFRKSPLPTKGEELLPLIKRKVGFAIAKLGRVF